MSNDKTIVCYFTGTGNSLAVARRIASGLGGAGIINIAGLQENGPITSASRIVVVFPVYIWGLPRIIREFFKSFPVAQGIELWVIATNGGLAGDPIRMIRKIGKRRGFTIASGFLAWTPENFVLRYPMWPDWLNRIAIQYSFRKADRVVANILAGKKGRYERSLFPINTILSWIHGFAMRKIYVEKTITCDRFFRVTAACASCGICARVCPRNNIALMDGKPVWGSDCEICVACLQWCPAAAIQAGKDTAKRGRYHHPEITVADMMLR